MTLRSIDIQTVQMKTRLVVLLLLCSQTALADEDALIQCRQLEDIAERVACYDKVVDSRYPVAAGERTEPAATAVPDARSLFGTNDAEARRIVETSLAVEQIDQIEATVTGIRESAGRKLTVTLDNGQTWRQLDSQTLRLKSGETVVVRKASLGSYLMEKKSGSRRIRVKRVD